MGTPPISIEADGTAGAQAPRAAGASPWFVACCMVVIAVSLSAVLYLQAGFGIAEAGWVGLATLMVMVLAEFFSARNRERSQVEHELREMNRVAVALTRELSGLHGRIGEVEKSLSSRIDEAVDTRLGAITADLQTLETLVRDLGDTFEELQRAPASPAAGASPYAPAPPDTPSGYFAAMAPAAAAEALASALDDERIDLLLQPIVTLPQRRVRHYEALARLRGGDGETIPPADYLPVAERSGRIAALDAMVLDRCVQVVRRMVERNRDMIVFCNLSTATLADGAFVERFAAHAERNEALPRAVVFEFAQDAFDAIGPIEQSGLDALADLGCRFGIDNVRRLDIDGVTLAQRKVRYVKIDAGLLLDPPETAGAHIHVADFARLLARSGIELIATRIESEPGLVDLLDYDIALGQGFLFSPPRPVRGEILRSGRTALARTA